MQGGAGRGKVATSMINVIVFATISVQSSGEDGWIPRADQQASTSFKQTVPTATSGCSVVFPSWLVSQLDWLVGRLPGWINGEKGCVVSQEAAKDRERLKELEAECLILKGRLNR